MNANRLFKQGEHILNADGLTVGDYWSWAYSDILNNVNRGVFAEFLVGSALETLQSPRQAWNEFDLQYERFRVEVKSSKYLQSWNQEKLSKISFSIVKTKGWNADTNINQNKKMRNSDLYVFCLFTEKEIRTANVINTDAWEFYVVSTGKINRKFLEQKTIGLTSLKKLATPVKYSQIKSSVDSLIEKKLLD